MSFLYQDANVSYGALIIANGALIIQSLCKKKVT